MVLSSERLKKLMEWSYAEVGWFQLEEMSTLSSVNQRVNQSRAEYNTMQSQPKSSATNAKSSKGKGGQDPEKEAHSPKQEPWQGYFFFF